MTKERSESMISRIKECILKTDMSHHFSMLENVVEIVEHIGYFKVTRSLNSASSTSSGQPLTPLQITQTMTQSPAISSPRSPKPSKLHELVKGHGMTPLSQSSSFTSMPSLNKLPLSSTQRETIIHVILHAAGLWISCRYFESGSSIFVLQEME
jgi:hypothetical protein